MRSTLPDYVELIIELKQNYETAFEPDRLSDFMTAQVKRFLVNVTLAICALAISFGFGEFVVRLLYKNETVLFPRYHTGYHYGRYLIRGIRPNISYWMTSIDGSWKFVTNSRGFRNRKEFSYSKPANTIRVLSLGDSHTQGYEVRQDLTFSAVLERYLNHHAKNAEVINAGVSGFSTAEELVFLENEGVRYSPDVVVLGFFANDFEDNLKAALFGLDAQNRLTEERYEHLPGVRIQDLIYSIPGVQWLGENSYFYSLLFNNVWEFFKASLENMAKKRAAVKGTPGPATPKTFEYAVPTTTTFSKYEIALATALIERMHRFCEERGIQFIVVDIPMRTGPYSYKTSLPPELIASLAVSHVEYLSSASLLQTYDGAAEMHVPHGHQHISEFTHTLIGTEIGHRLVTSRAGGVKK